MSRKRKYYSNINFTTIGSSNFRVKYTTEKTKEWFSEMEICKNTTSSCIRCILSWRNTQIYTFYENHTGHGTFFTITWQHYYQQIPANIIGFNCNRTWSQNEFVTNSVWRNGNTHPYRNCKWTFWRLKINKLQSNQCL